VLNKLKDPVFWLFKINVEFLLIEIYLFYIEKITLSQLFFILLGNVMLFAVTYMTKEIRDLNKRLRTWLRL
jgi:hypothetical protein|tara:strand:- start:969 stop:1181 length:213 start_codon:yes stop_codon:yes gene_type:complete